VISQRQQQINALHAKLRDPNLSAIDRIRLDIESDRLKEET
jgi:hypothetical protein